jgi:hypothetical protein
MCNTATTPNLDGRDGAYNPQVNLHNNSAYGEDTIPPARFAPGEIVATSNDRNANTVTISVARFPGDDWYCGTPAAYDFRFSLSAPITTQAAFDAAAHVASVPAPSHGNHDGGGDLVVGDPRFAGQIAYLAVQVVDDAGNRSPLTSLGAFSFAPFFTLQRATLAFGRSGPGSDRLSLKGLVPMPLSAFAPTTDAFTLTLADADGTFYAATIPAGQFIANAAGTRVRFHDSTGTIANGLRTVVVRVNRTGGVKVRISGRMLSLAGADRPDITTTLRFGATPFQSTNTFRVLTHSLKFP